MTTVRSQLGSHFVDCFTWLRYEFRGFLDHSGCDWPSSPWITWISVRLVYNFISAFHQEPDSSLQPLGFFIHLSSHGIRELYGRKKSDRIGDAVGLLE